MFTRNSSAEPKRLEPVTANAGANTNSNAT
jgi:hypothetical protein